MIMDETHSSARYASKPVDRYTTGTRSASLKGQRGEDVNVKRAVATVAGTIGVLLLAAVVGLGHIAGHSVSTPAKATLAATIYGDSVNVPASVSSTSVSIYGDIYGDGASSSISIYGDGGAVSADIYGD
jgi:hypothetical protein